MESIPYELIGKYLVGECSEQEKKVITDWRNESQENEREFQLFLATWHTNKKQDEELDRKGNEILNEILGDSDNQVRFPWYYRLAAVLALFLFIGLLYTTFFAPKEEILISFKAEKPGVLHELKDGTKVWLSMNSEISYAEDFVENRTLQLVGDAYFQVKRDPDHPFVIEALGTQTKVLGTAFNLTAEKNQEDIIILVDEGKVSFSKGASSEILIKGQSAKVEKSSDQIAVATVENSNHLFWQTGVLEFNDVKLSEVVKDLTKYYGKPIQLESVSEELKYSGRFENKNIQQILDIISLTVNLKVEFVNNKYVISTS
ncbi:MAG: DUF4974 domain-containing protein [bacterium]|nr:DUF4974 domain-containing protein [bacterium]